MGRFFYLLGYLFYQIHKEPSIFAQDNFKKIIENNESKINESCR